MRKLISLLLLPIFLFGSIFESSLYAVNTSGTATPWTREKAVHLAKSVLFYADSGTITALEQAGSATAAVNLLFPNTTGPDRTAFDNFITTYTSSGFSWTGGTSMTRLYQLIYAADPYEAKRKLFSLFEDIYSVNTDGDRDITTRDIYDQHALIYANMLGSYETLVKKLLYNNGGLGDYAEGDFLDLFNQTNPNNPNENYARELLQLFLMGEYEPFKSKDNNDTRNYEESDVKALARILTGLRVDKTTRALSFDINTHYSGAVLTFLSGSANTALPAYYDTASGTVNPTLILAANAGNNGLTDNVIEYIFAKRSQQIALFLADRLYRFYIADTPTRGELDTIANMIVANNFDMLASVKQVLASDMMYSEKSMNTVRYKNPLELAIGTIKLLQGNTLSGITSDQNIYDTNLLRRLEWTPYYPGSVFGRDGFDDSNKWTSTSIQNTWMSATNYFSYRTGTGSVNFRSLLGNYRRELTNEIIPIITSPKNTFTGSLTIVSGSIDTNPSPTNIVIQLASVDPEATNSGTIITSTGSEENTSSIDSAGSGTSSTGSTNSGTTDTSSNSRTIDTGTTDNGSGTIDTGSGNITNSGSTNTGTTDTSSGNITDTGSTDTNSGNTVISFTATGETNTGRTLIAAAIFINGVTAVSSGSVFLPNFRLDTDIGTLTISGGSYDAGTKTLSIYSGSLSDNGFIAPIYSGTIVLSPSSIISADVITSDDIIDAMSKRILGEVALPGDTRTMIKTFLETDESGNTIPVAPSSTEYYDKKIRGLVSILLSQPEYVLLHGADAPTTADTNTEHLLDSESSKLIFIELYGGNDYLSSIVPKDEYATYLNYRTNSSGSIALSGSDLVDIGNFYMNSALAYGSGGTGFKSLYDEGSLKLFNRVGAYKHSQDHDAAAKQITSYNNTTSASAEGLFGHLIKTEYEGSNTDSLGAKRPNIFRGGHYVNLGGSVILSNPMNGSIKYHMDTLETIVQSRVYPGNTRSIFSDAGKISDIAKVSVAAGGPSGANGDMNNIFKFTKILMENNIGRTYYMGGYGGYDTHENEYSTVQKNLRFVSDAVTSFFNNVKGTQDVTIVIFSEFGRTNKVNGSLGTDHGDGGGMYVITSNQNLKNSLTSGTYGNMSIKDAKANSLGVGVDYRSVYGKIFEALYGIDGRTYFNTNVNLDDDVSLDPNEMSLLSYSYQASGQNITMNGEFSMTGRNYDPGKAGYTRILSGTGASALKNTSITSGTSPQGYRYTFRLSSGSQPYFQIDSFSNQYALTSVSGMLTGSTAPIILGSSVRAISQTSTSILPIFNNTSVPRTFVGTGIILESTGGNTITPDSNTDFSVHFNSGITQVTSLTSSSGSLTWNGGFIFGENINRDTFIPRNAIITNSGISLQKNQVARLVKIGADKLGVGMQLNQDVQIEFRNITDTGSYRVLSSEDGVNWSDVETSGKEYQRDMSNSIIVNTHHFSYFALVSSTATLVSPPSCTMSITPSTATNGTPVTLSWNLTNVATGTLSPGGSIVNAAGSLSIIPPSSATTQYTISITNSVGNASCNTSILMTAPTNTGTTNTGSTNTGTTNTGTTNTGTTNTGSTPPPTIITGPGGGGGGGGGGSSTVTMTSLAKTRDVCVDGDSSGDNYDGKCTLEDTSTNVISATPFDLPESLVDLIIDLESKTDEALSKEDQQKARIIALDIRKEINKYPASKNQRLQEALILIRKELQEAGGKNTKQALREIMQVIQSFSNNEPTVHPETPETLTKEIAGVRYVDAERALTLRSSTVIGKNNIITYIQRNQPVEVLETIGKWTKVIYDGVEGYVKSVYLREEVLADKIRSGELSATSGKKGTIQVNHSAYIRRGIGVQATIGGVAYTNEEVTILDETGGWLEVLWNGTRGYIAKWLIRMK